MGHRVIGRALAAALAAALLGAFPAAAAPQILGVMASATPIPLQCDRRECSAVIGTFCLQRDRDIPRYGEPFEAVKADQLTLFIATADGGIQRLPGAPWLRFTGYNGYTTARVVLSRESLTALGGDAAAVAIGPGVSLVPMAQLGDANPQSAEEIMTATGALRIAAGRYLDRPTVRADAARLVMALLNGVPESRTIRDDNSGLWQRAITEELVGGMAPGAVPIAARAYQRCATQFNPRGCLISRHRELMVPENREFWSETSGY
ncbi:MAG: hypothetical protein ACREEE_08545 [Dongiaceae bacterium]